MLPSMLLLPRARNQLQVLLQAWAQVKRTSRLELYLDWISTSPALDKAVQGATEPEPLSLPKQLSWDFSLGAAVIATLQPMPVGLSSLIADAQAARRQRCRQLFEEAAAAPASAQEQHAVSSRAAPASAAPSQPAAPSRAPAARAGLSFLASLHKTRASGAAGAADRAGTTGQQTGPETLWVTLPELHVSLLRLLHEADSAVLAQGTGLSQAVRCAGHIYMLHFGSECTAYMGCVLNNGERSALDLRSSLQTRALCIRSGSVVYRAASWLDLGPVQVGLDAAAEAERAHPGSHEHTLRTYAALLAARHGALCVLHLGIRCGYTVIRCARALRVTGDITCTICWSSLCSRRQPCTGPVPHCDRGATTYLQPCTSASCRVSLAGCLNANCLCCRAAAEHLQRVLQIMPRIAQQMQACLEALQAASAAVDARSETDHPKHGLLKDQLLRISAHQQVRKLVSHARTHACL